MHNYLSAMTPALCIGLIAIIINIFTLVIVCIQTSFAKRSYNQAENMYKINIRLIEMEQIPNMNLISSVGARFENWIGNLNEIEDCIHIIYENRDVLEANELAEKGLKEPASLVKEPVYESSPVWLQEIYFTGAKYYYNSMSNLRNLWDDGRKLVNFEFCEPRNNLDSIFDIIGESKKGLEGLLEYITNAIPKVILDAPDSSSVEDFF